MYVQIGLIAVGIFIGAGALYWYLRRSERIPNKPGSKGSPGGGGGGPSKS